MNSLLRNLAWGTAWKVAEYWLTPAKLLQIKALVMDKLPRDDLDGNGKRDQVREKLNGFLIDWTDASLNLLIEFVVNYVKHNEGKSK